MYRIRIVYGKEEEVVEFKFYCIIRAAKHLEKILHDFDTGNPTFENLFPATTSISLWSGEHCIAGY
jgi:hypothetical protein